MRKSCSTSDGIFPGLLVPASPGRAPQGARVRQEGVQMSGSLLRATARAAARSRIRQRWSCAEARAPVTRVIFPGALSPEFLSAVQEPGTHGWLLWRRGRPGLEVSVAGVELTAGFSSLGFWGCFSFFLFPSGGSGVWAGGCSPGVPELVLGTGSAAVETASPAEGVSPEGAQPKRCLRTPAPQVRSSARRQPQAVSRTSL